MRLGTSDFYAVVEGFAEVADSLVVHVETGGTRGLGELILFVRLADGVELTDDLRSRIRTALASELSPLSHPRCHRGGPGAGAPSQERSSSSP